jgi:ribonuclease HIII
MTTTLKLAPAEIAALRKTLNDEGYEFRRLDHAHFQARAAGVVISAYRSGKVVVQGHGADAFLIEHGFQRPTSLTLSVPEAGSDESGKGDYFGPLVVAAVVVSPEQAVELDGLGVRDCKKMADGTILRAAAGIRRICAHSVRALTPPEYNEAHEKHRNVALFLAEMHAEALAGAIDAAGGVSKLVIDQFTSAERLERALEAAGVEAEVEIRHRAEDHIAVAAASVLARAEFLIGLKELGHDYGEALPKGAGIPVERAARRIFEAGGIEALEAIAKIHFRTTDKVTGLF